MAITKAGLKKQLHAMGIKTYKDKVTGGVFVKKSDVKKVLASEEVIGSKLGISVGVEDRKIIVNYDFSSSTSKRIFSKDRPNPEEMGYTKAGKLEDEMKKEVHEKFKKFKPKLEAMMVEFLTEQGYE